MKRFNQNKIQTNETGKSSVQQVSLNKPKRGYYTIVTVTIFAIIVLHFAAQFVFFNSKSLQSEKAFAETENEQIKQQGAEIKTELKAKISDIVTTPVPTSPTVRRESKIAASPVAEKKKQPRETRAERLRRAEKILTGI